MVISRLRQQAHERLSDEGFEDSVLEFEPSLDVRYKGQAFELSIPIGDEIADAGALLSEFLKLMLSTMVTRTRIKVQK